MTLNLEERLRKGNETLNGISINRRSILTWFFGDDSLSLKEKDDHVFLKKVSSKPYAVLEQMMDCYLKKGRSFDTVVKSKTPVPVPDSAVTRLPPEATKKDSAHIVKDSVTIPKQLVKRKNTEQSHIEVNVKSITLNVYDNAIVDGDTISVFYNGKLLLSHQRLSEKPIVINLELDEKQIRQEIILFAENLGSIPPNTALIVIYAGDKRYELFSSASLEENAVLVFDYKPK